MAEKSPVSYKNPVWPGYCADPFVLKHEGHYYAYGTYVENGSSGNPEHAAISGREFILLKSPDLTQWEQLGGALESVPGIEGHAYWAPEVAFSEGEFLMYYSALDEGLQRIRAAVAASPEGPFVDLGKRLLPLGGFTIDASPFKDPQDGVWYLFYSRDWFDGRTGTGIAVVQLADDMVTTVGKPKTVVRATADWQISAVKRLNYGRVWDRWHTVEGAHVVYRDGLYYCFYSGGAWINETYGVSFAVAEHPLGPWTDTHSQDGPAVLRTIPGHVIGPGHNSVVLGPDDKTLMCVYHAWDTAQTARRLCIDPIVWTEQGPSVTPTFESTLLPV